MMPRDPRSKSHRQLACAFAALSIAAACRSPKPTSLSGWDGCLMRAAELQEVEELGKMTLQPVIGDHQVLSLDTEWGRSWFVTEYSFGWLLLELPPTLPVGLEIPLSGMPARYREGGQFIVFESRVVQGSAKVLSSDEAHAELDLTVSASSPQVDPGGAGEVTWAGRVDVPVVSGTSCP